MKSHELAKQLLSGPDVEVVTVGMGDSLFPVTTMRLLTGRKSDSCGHYYEVSQQTRPDEERVELLRLD